jgi:hypothetical protein
MAKSCSDNNAGLWAPLSRNFPARSQFGGAFKVPKARWYLGQLPHPAENLQIARDLLHGNRE